MQSIRFKCQKCQRDVQTGISHNSELVCTFCQNVVAVNTPAIFESCPFCRCKQFYAQKDFNRTLGCLIMAVGILLVPKTYGLSLPVFAALDWLLYRRVKDMAVCYCCGAEFCEIPYPKHLKPYRHAIAVKYDKYR